MGPTTGEVYFWIIVYLIGRAIQAKFLERAARKDARKYGIELRSSKD